MMVNNAGDSCLYPRGVDSAKVIQVIETKAARGSGSKTQPSRLVTQYWSLDGTLLVESDPIHFCGAIDSASENTNSESM